MVSVAISTGLFDDDICAIFGILKILMSSLLNRASNLVGWSSMFKRTVFIGSLISVLV